MTKAQLVAELKAEYPTLTKSFDGVDIELTPEEYEDTIKSWADAKLNKLKEDAKAEADAAAKVALLDRLGITAEEAVLLLG
jgi:hypothetical protein